jgi:cytosine/adenosine deaminase-related metal-dependent hydrolase
MIKVNSKFILTNSQVFPLLKNAELLIDENTGKIKSVSGAACREKNAVYFEEDKSYSTLIIPGLLNAHIHTELTIDADCSTPHIFSKWVISLIKMRMNLAAQKVAAIRRRAYEISIKSGVTAIGDIVPLEQFEEYMVNCCINSKAEYYTAGKVLKSQNLNLKDEAGKYCIDNNINVNKVNKYANYDIAAKNFNIRHPRIKSYIEVIGLNPFLSDIKIKELEKMLSYYYKYYNNNGKNKSGDFCASDADVSGNNDDFCRREFIAEDTFLPGLSPHSVYSVSKELFQELLKKNKKWKLDMVIHASEHKSEISFLKEGSGDIAENLLTALQLDAFSNPSKTHGAAKYSTPVDYLNSMGLLSRNTALIHANEINEHDIKIIKDSKSSIIHCPRSNAFFNSSRLPLRKILDNNINVGLGTDSLYSNSSISILDELKYARIIHYKENNNCVSSKELFKMATVNNATILNIPHLTGILETGSYADFIIFKIPKYLKLTEDNVFDKIIDLEEKDILKVFIGGKEVYESVQ